MIGFRLLNVQSYRSRIPALVQQFETVKALLWTKNYRKNQEIRAFQALQSALPWLLSIKKP